MKVKAIRERCTGHGRCWVVAPDVFTSDDEGFVAERGTVVEIPAGKEDEAQDAVLSCPESALEVVD